jgi:hypothetical protein
VHLSPILYGISNTFSPFSHIRALISPLCNFHQSLASQQASEDSIQDDDDDDSFSESHVSISFESELEAKPFKRQQTSFLNSQPDSMLSLDLFIIDTGIGKSSCLYSDVFRPINFSKSISPPNGFFVSLHSF